MKNTNYESLANVINPNGQVLNIDNLMARAGVTVIEGNISSFGNVKKVFLKQPLVSAIKIDATPLKASCVLCVPFSADRTFTILRLFCYAILHEGYLVDNKKWNFNAQPDDFIEMLDKERAEAFARAILMPVPKLREVKAALGHSHQGVILNDVADMFEIDESQVLARWQDLDMID